MKYKNLGNSGLKVSELCFGTLTFGGTQEHKELGALDQKEVNRLVDMAIDGGINFFDTADVYSHGLAEEMLGRALKGKRNEVIITSKVFGKMGDGPNQKGLSRYHVINACEASLKRLKTDHIDLYLIHNYDSNTPMEETLRTMNDLVRQGKVRYIGASNLSGWQLTRFLWLSEKYNLEKFIVIQSLYTLVNRHIEFEVLPAARNLGIGVTTWGSLGGGFLTGKYRKDKPAPEDARRVKKDEPVPQFDEEWGYRILDELEKIARNHNATIAQTAINYLLRKPGVSSVIFGATKPQQMKDNLGATQWKMAPEEVEKLDEISRPVKIYPYSM